MNLLEWVREHYDHIAKKYELLGSDYDHKQINRLTNIELLEIISEFLEEESPPRPAPRPPRTPVMARASAE